MAGPDWDTFHWLLDTRSVQRFVMDQLNSGRPSHAAREIDSMSNPDVRGAAAGGAVHPILYTGRQILRITQEELATWWDCRAAGQRIAAELEAQGMISVEYGGLRVRSEALRRAGPWPAKHNSPKDRLHPTTRLTSGCAERACARPRGR